MLLLLKPVSSVLDKDEAAISVPVSNGIFHFLNPIFCRLLLLRVCFRLPLTVLLVLHLLRLCVLVMSIALGGVRRSDQDSPEKLEFCRRPRDGCSDALSPELDSCDSLASSSIGRNSDASGSLSNDEEGGENEAQSKSSREEPLDMELLEEALPLRRGISKFYNGKSKSFTILAHASSMKDIAKSENAYTRKRRNLLAFSHVWDKNRTISRRSSSSGISKRGISSGRSTLALAVAMSNSSESINSEDWNARSPPLGPGLYHLPRASGKNIASLLPPPCNFSTWRSYSVDAATLFGTHRLNQKV